ncbi:MAG: hypothetical protein V4750_13135, partial [Pseudomonadota bacterium]
MRPVRPPLRAEDQETQIDEAWDGFNIVNPPEIILPNTDPLQGGIPISIGDALGTIGDLQSALGLPNINIPGEVIDTFEEDLRSKKTNLLNERDPKGLPVFLAGSKD